MANKFRRKSEGKAYVEREIVNDGRVVGSVRLKPNGILWKPRSAHRWHALTLAKFASYAVAKGAEQRK